MNKKLFLMISLIVPSIAAMQTTNHALCEEVRNAIASYLFSKDDVEKRRPIEHYRSLVQNIAVVPNENGAYSIQIDNQKYIYSKPKENLSVIREEKIKKK